MYFRMKKRSLKVLKLFLMFFLLIFLVFIGKSRLYSKTEIKSSSFTENRLKINSLVISDPIYIDEAQDWIDLKNEGKCTGEGTQGNPYIISNLKINGQGSGCIFMGYQTVYSKIINCELYNSSNAINFYGSDNCEILNNTIYDNDVGIYLNIPPIPPEYINNILIQGNLISYNTEVGIKSYAGLQDCIISDNTIIHNQDDGIYLVSQNERLHILNNNFLYNGKCGLSLWFVDFSVIQGNVINYNERGMWLYGSDSNTITDNSINYNEGTFDHAIYFEYSDDNVVENNDISDNGFWEIWLEGSSNNIIQYNNVIESNFYEDRGFCCMSGASSGNIIENNYVLYDDSYEYNDFFIDTKELNLGYYDNLVALDEDWYKLILEENNKYEISLNCSEQGDNLDIYLYDMDKSLIMLETSGVYNKTFSFDATYTGFYYILISNGINPSYQLDIQPYQEPPPPPPQSLTITVPDSSSSWETDTSRNISWTSTGSISNVKIELFDDNVYIMEITPSTPNDGQYSWIIPTDLEPSDQYQIKIIDVSSSSTYDFSAYFEISHAVSMPSGTSGIHGYNLYILIGVICVVSAILFKNRK